MDAPSRFCPGPVTVRLAQGRQPSACHRSRNVRASSRGNSVKRLFHLPCVSTLARSWQDGNVVVASRRGATAGSWTAGCGGPSRDPVPALRRDDRHDGRLRSVAPTARPHYVGLMKNSAKAPLTLDDLALGINLPPGLAYGADHVAPIADDAADKVYATAVTAIRAASERLDTLQLMAALGALERHHAMAEPPAPITIAGVELMQALVLQHMAIGSPPQPSDVGDLLHALCTYQQLFLRSTTRGGLSSDDPLVRRRDQTLKVRHTFYPEHAVRVFDAVGEQVAAVGHAALGMSLADASRVAIAAAAQVGSDLAEAGVPAEVSKWLAKGDGGFDVRWLDLFEVRPEAFRAAVPHLPGDAVERLLASLSIAPGELAGKVRDHLALDNPVWRRPFVRAGDRLYCFSPGTVLAAHADIMAELAGKISRKPGELLGKARGTALERMTAQAIRDILPHAEVLTSVKWTDPGTGIDYETDVIALIDGHFLIFEAKGYVLSALARRGSREWFDTFDDIVVEAAVQTSRLERVLRQVPASGLMLRAAEGDRLLRRDRIRNVARFGVSMERVTMASFGLEETLARRIAVADAEPMPVFTIGDLWQLRDLIDGEGRRLHFLLRRAELERDHQFIGDELDLLALYLKTGFVVPPAQGPEPVVLGVYGLSDFLRFHQRFGSEGKRKMEPPRLVTGTWARALERLADRRPPFWTDLTYDLLNIELASQELFLDDIRRLRRKVRRVPYGAEFPLATMQAPKQLRPAMFYCLVSGKRSDALRLGEGRAAFAQLERQHPDERLVMFVLDARADPRMAKLVYYRGKDWSSRYDPVRMEGRTAGSHLFIDAAALA